jgi:hypothetical protein
VDRAATKARLGEYPSVERVWALSLLGRSEQAVAVGAGPLRDRSALF